MTKGNHVVKKPKLTPTQESAYRKLTNEWQSGYDLQESMATLDALVKKGYAKSSGHGSLSSVYSPRTSILYKRNFSIPERVL